MDPNCSLIRGLQCVSSVELSLVPLVAEALDTDFLMAADWGTGLGRSRLDWHGRRLPRSAYHNWSNLCHGRNWHLEANPLPVIQHAAAESSVGVFFWRAWAS